MSNKAKYVGRVVAVLPTETLGKDKTFKKRVIIVSDSEDGAKYPNTVPFEATGDKCDYLDAYKSGDVVTIDYFPNGRSWDNPKSGKTQYFSSLRISFIKKGEETAADEGAVAAEADSDGDPDDMPF